MTDKYFSFALSATLPEYTAWCGEPRHDPEPSQVEAHSKPIVLNRAQVRLRFEQDKDTGIQVIQIVDAESGKLVRQIPPEELLNITKALRDIKGLMVSKES
jgi:flagellar protein FlaG